MTNDQRLFDKLKKEIIADNLKILNMRNKIKTKTKQINLDFWLISLFFFKKISSPPKGEYLIKKKHFFFVCFLIVNNFKLLNC